MQFVHGPSLTQAIRTVISGDSADLAVAFWGRDASRILGLKAKVTRVICDLFSGSCNPQEIRFLLESGVQVYDVKGLHAKVYIGQNAVVISSANASANGLGEEGAEVFDSNEAGYVSHQNGDLDQARTWFEATLRRSQKVDFGMLPEVERLWRVRRQNVPVRSRRSLLDVLLQDPTFFDDKSLYVALYNEQEPSEAVHEEYSNLPVAQQSKLLERYDYPYYFAAEDWHLEEDFLLLDLSSGVRGALTCNGVWRVQEIIREGAIVPAEPVRRPLGLAFPARDREELAKRVKAALKAERVAIDGSLLRIHDLAKALSA